MLPISSWSIISASSIFLTMEECSLSISCRFTVLLDYRHKYNG